MVVVVVGGRAGAQLGSGGEIMLMSRPRHPLWWWWGVGMNTKGHREPVGVPL